MGNAQRKMRAHTAAAEAVHGSAATAPTGAGGPTLIPATFTEVLHLVRHGQAFSNVAGEVDRAAYKSEAWFDASLSPGGWIQAEALGRHIKALGLKPQLVVVSPLTRALQTASAAFGGGPWVEGGGSQPPLMAKVPAMKGSQEAHAAISAQGAPRFLALELAREEMGVHPCDRRHDTSHYISHFPAVDFSLITEEKDVLWKADERESHKEASARAAAFLTWLLARPEQEIAVVSHSGFLNALLCNHLGRPGHSNALDSDLERWFENCELRTVMAAVPEAKAAISASPPANFPGGQRAMAMVP